MTAAGLLLLALLANYLPELIVHMGGGSLGAWFVVADNTQIAALWWAVALLSERMTDESRVLVLPTLAVCAYGVFEAAQVPICRLAFPMDAPPPRHPEGVCGAAGVPTFDLAPLLIAMCAVLVARTLPTLTDAQPRRA